MRYLFALTLTAALAIAGAACTGPRTGIEASWSTPCPRCVELHHVVTLFASRDPALRRSAEDRMAARLAAQGVSATPAYRVLTPADLRDARATGARLRALGYDGLVTMRVVSSVRRVASVPPDIDAYWGFAWPSFYGPEVYTPGNSYTESIVRVETDAYSLRTNQLVWTALSKTVNPNDLLALVDDVARSTAVYMYRRGLIA